MKRIVFILLLLLSGSYSVNVCYANDEQAGGSQRVGNNLIPLHVEGRYFKDPSGNIVNLHGFGQTYSPWFNERGKRWTDYNVNACLYYNQNLINKMLAAGWKGNWLRLHMDPYWSNTPGEKVNGESDIHAFDFERFKTYLESVFIPMAQFAMNHGMYVVMRPPGVFPDSVALGDDYQKYLIKVWDYVSSRPALKDNPGILYELGNEPVRVYTSEGVLGGGKEMSEYIQPVVDAVRKNANNIVLLPGLSWQSQYVGYASYPVTGGQIGYAVHCYPGWYNGAHDGSKEVQVDFENFRQGWYSQIGPVSSIAPIVVTEMDWAPVKYDASWGKSTTSQFGNAFKRIADEEGNVSWMVFTSPDILAQYDGVAPADGDTATVLNDPEACVWPAYHWFADYAKVDYPSTEAYGKTLSRGDVVSINFADETYTMKMGTSSFFKLIATYADGSTDNITAEADYSSDELCSVVKGCLKGIYEGNGILTATYKQLSATASINVESYFPLTNEGFNPNIWEKGSFDESTGNLITGQYGFGGWRYTEGIDISAYKYLVVELNRVQESGAAASFRLFDQDSYWSKPAMYDMGNSTRIVIDLQNMKRDGTTEKCDPSHIYYAGFWTMGGKVVSIKKVFLSNDGKTSATTDIIKNVEGQGNTLSARIYNLQGQVVANGMEKLQSLPHGIYIINGKKVAK